jgi:hypothetical protein
MSNWANGIITGETFFQKATVKSVRFVVIETERAKEVLGVREFTLESEGAIGATMALIEAHDKWPLNSSLALKLAIQESIKSNLPDTFKILKVMYEREYGDCPYALMEDISTNMYTSYDMGTQNDEEESDEDIEKRIDSMDDEIEGNRDVVDEAEQTSDGKTVSHFNNTTTQDRSAQKQAAKKRASTPQAKLKSMGFNSIPGYGSFWSKSGQLPAERKVVGGQIVNVTQQTQPNAAGKPRQQAQQAQQVQQKPAREVVVVDKDSPEYRKAKSIGRKKWSI